MEALDMILFVLSLCLKVFSVYYAAVVVLGWLRRRRTFPHAAPQIRFAVLAAARNEEAVIGGMVRSVLAQNYPENLVDIFVIPNNCTDHTEEAAAAAGAGIIHCLGPVRSKGDALHQAFAQLLPKGYDAFLVLDADNTLSPDYLAYMNDAFAAGARVCRSRIKASNPTAGAVAGCYGLYNTCFDLIWNRPRSALGLSAKLIGTGFAVRREVLEDMGGWNTSTIAEDAEFASQLAAAGQQVVWIPEAVNYDEAPTGFLVSLRQRKRWCSGIMQVARAKLAKLWTRDCSRPMLRWDMTIFLIAPFASALSGLLLVTGVLSSVLTGNLAAMALYLVSLAVSWAGALALGLVLSLIGGYGWKGMGPAILLFPVFTASWMPLQVVSLFKDTKKWRVIVHRGAAPAAAPRA